MEVDAPCGINQITTPSCVLVFKVNKEKARALIPNIYFEASPVMLPTSKFSQFDTTVPMEHCDEIAHRSPSPNWHFKSLDQDKNHHSGIHNSKQMFDLHSDSAQCVSLENRDTPSQHFRTISISRGYIGADETTNHHNAGPESCDKIWASSPQKTHLVQGSMSQAFAPRHEEAKHVFNDRDITIVSREGPDVHPELNGIENKLLLGHEIHDRSQMMNATGIPKEATQRNGQLEVVKLQDHSSEDEGRAAAASQKLLPLSMEAFEALRNKKATITSKRDAGESNASNDEQGPIQKKRKTIKIVRKTHAKASVTNPLPNLLKFTSNGNKKITKDVLKDLPTICRAPAHVKQHLQDIQACALKSASTDKDTMKAHIGMLVSMTKVLSKRVSPWISSGSDEKTLDDYRWKLRGIRSPIYHHQLVAAAIMVSMEARTDDSHSRSGLLCDHMGYGKTVEALSLIMSRPPGEDSNEGNGEKLTLVVCPTSVGQQWVDEIKKHCVGVKSALWGDNLSREAIFGLDVLVVSYERLRHIYKKKPKSALYQGKLYRVILDEIHEIKSPKASSVTFKSCMALDAKHHWGLTGTPTPNGMKELYPYLLFIRHPTIATMADFRSSFVRKSNRKALPLQEKNLNLTQMLGAYILLRTPKHCFLGEALVDLPEAQEIYEHIDLGKEERIIYDMIESHIKDHMEKKTAKNMAVKAKDKKKATWTTLYESLLRFRQCVASPLLLENLMKDKIWTRKQAKEMKKRAIAEGCGKTPFIDMIERWIAEPNNPRSQEMVDFSRMYIKYRCPGCENPALQDREPHQAGVSPLCPFSRNSDRLILPVPTYLVQEMSTQLRRLEKQGVCRG